MPTPVAVLAPGAAIAQLGPVSLGTGLAALGLLALLTALAVLVIFLGRRLRRSHQVAEDARLISQQVIDTLPDAILVADEAGRIVQANAGLSRTCGISPLAALRMSLSDIPLRNDSGEAVPWPATGTVAARLGTGEPSSHVQIGASSLPGRGGLRILHIRDVSADVRSRREITTRQQELELLASLGRELNRLTDEEELLRASVSKIAQQIPLAYAGGIFVVDHVAHVLRLSASFGLDPEFIEQEATVPVGECLCGHVAMTGSMLFSPCSLEDSLHTRRRGAPSHGHLVLPLKGEKEVVGVLFLYLRKEVSLERSHRHLLEVVASEVGLALMRVREHQALRQSRQRLQQIFEEAPDAIIIADREGTVQALNRRAKTWFQTQEKVGRHLSWQGVLSAAETPTIAFRDQLRLPGGAVTVDVTASWIDEEQLQLILRDVTREEELKRKALELQKMEAVGVLASGLAHNLNNVFAHLLSHLGLLEEELPPGSSAALKEHLRSAVSGIEQVSDLIERLLELARPRALKLEDLDLSQLVASQVELVRPLARKGIQLETRVEPGLQARVDRSILTQAVLNLVLNGLEALSGGGRLDVTLAQEGGQSVCLEVRDTGPGIAPEVVSRIFEPFYTTKEGGTGLGLSTAKAGILSLGGRIEVDSTPGSGTAFRIRLPGSKAAESPLEPGDHSLRILLAEDNPLLRRFLIRELAARGWEADAVDSVPAVRRKVASWQPCIAILDWHLGEETTRDLVTELHRGGVKVIVLTGDPEGVRGIRAPVLRKPLNWNRLEELVRSLAAERAYGGAVH